MGGNLFLSSRGSVVALIDNDNNSTSNTFEVRQNVATGGSSVFNINGTRTLVVDQIRVGTDINLSSGKGVYVVDSGGTQFVLGEDADNFGVIRWDTANDWLEIVVEDGGVQAQIAELANNAIRLQVPVTITGHFLAAADSTYNIGADATRFATGFFDTLNTGALISSQSRVKGVRSLTNPSSPVSALATDHVVLIENTTGSDITYTLPAAASNAGRELTISMSATVTNSVIVTDAGGSDTIIPGPGDVTLDDAGESVTVVCDGAAWYITSRVTV